MVWLWVAAAAVCAAALGFCVLIGLAEYARWLGRRQRPRPADAAIILGAYTDGYRPGTALTKRLKVGLDLYRRGYVRFLIVSGGRGPDESVSESRSMKRFLILNGVPADVILEDRHSADTWENLRNSLRVMEANGLRTAVVVTSDYHLPRAMAVASRLGMDVSGCAARSGSGEFRFAMREVAARLKYAVSGQAGLRPS
ncbi:YdcF family protein [Alicyclobacillus sp.]|uniref:YdcF family protein n=1 Tax=Alicyclobacillus sp. TaxID=61169 RepID=UPI0025BD6FA2|nr:YdcF family protein [Alicyclobacillus sp.]MCL6516366.1 YdcF family protein [Alicyclobacillus sp.]